MNDFIKCKKCRFNIINVSQTVSEHGDESVCKKDSNRTQQKLFIPESSYSSWILEAIETSNWTKGKFYCPTCNNKLGTFDFVSSGKCFCGQYCVPSVILMSSKIDYPSVNVKNLIS